MKKLLLVLSLVFSVLAIGAHSPAFSAESKNAADQKATPQDKTKPGDAKMKMMMPDFSFTCDRKRCACTGTDDCSDLKGTGLCSGGLSCNGEHCQCRR